MARRFAAPFARPGQGRLPPIRRIAFGQVDASGVVLGGIGGKGRRRFRDRVIGPGAEGNHKILERDAGQHQYAETKAGDRELSLA